MSGEGSAQKAAPLIRLGPIFLQLGLAGLSIAAIIAAKGYELWSAGQPGAGLFPFGVAVLLLLLLLASLIIEHRRIALARADDTEQPDRRRLFGYMVGLVLFAVATPWLGYVATSFCALVTMLHIGERFSPARAALLALAIALASWGFFAGVFSVPIQAWPTFE